jgi:hypothetical protein
MSKYTPGCELCSGSGGGGASDFVSLTDTPSSYAGSDGYLLSVSGSEVVFTPNAATGSGGQVEIIDNATTSDLNVNSTTSWVALQDGSVTTTTTGEHYISLDFLYLINSYSSIVNFKFKVEFDDGVNPVVVAGDAPKWRYRAGSNTSYLLGSFQDSVSLTKDTTYTVTAYVTQEASVSTNFLMPNSNGVGKIPTISIVAPGSGGGGGGTASPLTNKGDLYTFSTDNTRLPPGSDGQMLAVDSAEATGLKWVDSPSVIVTTDEITGDIVGLSSGVTTPVSGLSVSVTGSVGEVVELKYRLAMDCDAASSRGLAYRINSGSWIGLEIRADPINYVTVFAGSRLISLATGSNTVELGTYQDFGSANIYGTFAPAGFVAIPARMEIWQYKY